MKVDEDSSFWMMYELSRRGHQICHFESKDLFWDSGKTLARVSTSRFDPVHGFVKTSARSEPVELEKMDVIFIRKEPPFENEYLYTLQLLALLKDKVFILNDPMGIAACNEKLFILEFDKWIPESFVSGKPKDIQKFIVSQKTNVVLKPLNNKGGAGIVVTHGKDRNLPSLLDLMTGGGLYKVMAQRYVPHDQTGDKRILILNGEFLGCFSRVPSKADFRANLSVGGSMRKASLSSRDKKILQALKPALLRHGLYFVGIDVISGYLSEINVTSPSGIPEIRELSGENLEKKVADFIERR